MSKATGEHGSGTASPDTIKQPWYKGLAQHKLGRFALVAVLAGGGTVAGLAAAGVFSADSGSEAAVSPQLSGNIVEGFGNQVYTAVRFPDQPLSLAYECLYPKTPERVVEADVSVDGYSQPYHDDEAGGDEFPPGYKNIFPSFTDQKQFTIIVHVGGPDPQGVECKLGASGANIYSSNPKS